MQDAAFQPEDKLASLKFPIPANVHAERVVSVTHYTDSLFSFRITRPQTFRFRSGEFVMIGLPNAEKPIYRAYSVASPSWDDELEFYSIKVQDGPLTSRLQHLQPGDDLLVSRKPTGTLLLSDLLPGKHLYLFSTGTGMAAFMSVIRDLDVYERFEKVILIHGVRQVSELAYHDYITKELPHHEYLGEAISEKLIYYPTVTREPFRNQGRLTDLVESGKLFEDIGLPPLDPAVDRAMICGSAAMLKDSRAMLDKRGFRMSKRIGDPADYVIEHAFIEK